MAKLKFIFDEEEEKEKLKPSWIQRTRGIGELPEYEFDKIGLEKVKEIEIPKIEPISTVSMLPEDSLWEKVKSFAVNVFGTWEYKKKINPELQKMEDFGVKVLKEATKWAESRRGAEWKEYGSSQEEIAIIHEYLTGTPREGTLKDLIQKKNLEKYDKAIKLEQQFRDIYWKMANPTADLIGQIGWTGLVGLLGYQVLPLISKLPSVALNKLAYKVEGKTIKGKELISALRRVRYPEAPDIGKPSVFDKKVFAKFTEEGGLKTLAERMKGITITEVTPRFAFGAKLYAGIPADEIVRSLVETGKISAEISKELSLSTPEKVSQVIQNLSIASPAIASKLAPELVKLIPEVKEEVVKPKEYISAPKSARTFIAQRRIEQRADNLGLLAKFNSEKKIWEVWKVKEPTAFIKEPTEKVYEGRKVEEFLIKAKAEIKPVIPEEKIKKPIPKELKDEYLKIIGREVDLTADHLKLVEDIRHDIPISEDLQTRYPDLMKKIPEAKFAEIEVKPIVPEVKIEKPMATPKQIKKAHAIANSKAMISDKGKMKPQYRRLAEAMTGKKSIKKMTDDEAEIFIDSLGRLPEPKINKKTGELIPPTIARTTKLVLQDFFKRKYTEPDIRRYLTPQTYYAEMLGIKPLVEPYEIGKQKFDLEFRETSKTTDQIIDKLNKIAKTPLGEKLKSRVKNIPTKVESNMAELVNKYEEIPAKLEQGLKDVFSWFRSLSRDLIKRENEVRESVDLPPIKYRKAYFRHTADGMAKEMLEGKYPFPQGLKYWAERTAGKKIFNPMEFQRKLSDDLVDLWSKDFRAVVKSMLWNGLKEIHLAQPAKFLSEQLSIISKDLPIYKNLSPAEKKAYDEITVIPASTKKWLINYINQVMKGQETETDAGLNRIVTQSGLKGLFNKVLSPFGRRVGRKPITNTFQILGRITISGVMGWVPRQIIRNIFQQTQNLALFGVEATLKTFLPASVDKNLKSLLSDSLFLKSYTGFEELPTNLMGKLEKVWLGPYGIVACWNAAQGMKAAYWATLNLIKNPKYKDLGWADPDRITKNYDVEKGYLYPSEKEKLLKEMEYGASCTQYQYIPMGMPEVFRYKALIPATRLQSWWMNYFTKFLREAAYRFTKGETGYGQKLPWSYRINFAKYLIIGGAILTALGYRRSFLLGVAPIWLSPAMQVALGFYNYVTATSDWQRQKALRQIKYSWTAFIPGSLAWKDFIAVWNGEKDLKYLFFYKKIEKEKEKIPPPLEIKIPKSGKLKFIEPEIKKSKKLKFTF